MDHITEHFIYEHIWDTKSIENVAEYHVSVCAVIRLLSFEQIATNCDICYVNVLKI